MQRGRLIVMAPVLALAGCGGGLMDMGTPSRPPLAIADEVASVDRAALVGTWQCRELNPYPDQPDISQRLTLAADGTIRSEASMAMDDQMPGGGTMLVRSQGRWQAAGGGITTSDVQVDSEMVGGNAAMASIMSLASSMVNGMMDRAKPGNANVLKLDANTLILQAEGEDTPVLSCTRA